MTKPTLQAVDPDTSTTSAPNPFDLASLRLNPSFVETAGVKKLLTTYRRESRARKISSACIRRPIIARTSR